MSHLYVLKCTDNKYYVGTTDHLELRMKEHFEGEGTAWTTRYPPIEQVLTKRVTSKHDEDLWN